MLRGLGVSGLGCSRCNKGCRMLRGLGVSGYGVLVVTRFVV